MLGTPSAEVDAAGPAHLQPSGEPAANGEARGAAADGDAGLVVANDSDVKRCHMLASRSSRLQSPHLVVTNHDARQFPEAVGSAAHPLRFDRVLCDVPCSGDGTLRKNPAIWKRWNATPANVLHALQLQIACKGVRLCEVGGRLVCAPPPLPARWRPRPHPRPA